MQIEMCHGCGLRAGNTRVYFRVGQCWSPAGVCVGLLQGLGPGWFQNTTYNWGGHALISPKGGRPCSLSTLNYGVVRHLAYRIT